MITAKYAKTDAAKAASVDWTYIFTHLGMDMAHADNADALVG